MIYDFGLNIPLLKLKKASLTALNATASFEVVQVSTAQSVRLWLLIFKTNLIDFRLMMLYYHKRQ